MIKPDKYDWVPTAFWVAAEIVILAYCIYINVVLATMPYGGF